MPNLLPVDLSDYEIDEENVISELDGKTVGYKPAPFFDFSTGDLRMDGTGRILMANEVEAWIQWCEKTINTPRFKCKAYSTDRGIDYDEIFHAPDKDSAEAILTSEISDALAADPYGRTSYVNSVDIEWLSPDSVHVTAVVVGIDGATATIKSNISNV